MVTLKDIAIMAGVSIATVSRAINNPTLVAERSRNKVTSAIEELGYDSNDYQRHASNNLNQFVSVITPDISNPFYAEMLKGMDDVFSIHKRQIIVNNSENDALILKRIMDEIRGIGAIDIIFCYKPKNLSMLMEKINNDSSCIYITSECTNQTGNLIPFYYDLEKVAYTATRHLIEQTGTAPALLTNSDRTEALTNGYRKALNEGTDGKEYHVFSSFGINESYLAFQAFHTQHPDLRGLLTENESQAIGVLKYLADLRIQVPKDFSIISLGNSILAKSSTPSLTTVGQSGYQLGMATAQMLIEIDQKQTGFSLQSTMATPPSITIRESCK